MLKIKEIKDVLRQMGVYIFSSNNNFQKTVNMSLDDLDSLDAITLSKYIYLLSQYITYLYQQRNFIKIKEEQLEREYENLINSLIPLQEAKTLKEKRMLASNNPEAKKIEEQLIEIISIRKSLENVPEGYTEILNALKRYHETLLKA